MVESGIDVAGKIAFEEAVVHEIVEFEAGKARESVTETRDRLSEELGL
jgi:hypothetical protein